MQIIIIDVTATVSCDGFVVKQAHLGCFRKNFIGKFFYRSTPPPLPPGTKVATNRFLVLSLTHVLSHTHIHLLSFCFYHSSNVATNVRKQKTNKRVYVIITISGCTDCTNIICAAIGTFIIFRNIRIRNSRLLYLFFPNKVSNSRKFVLFCVYSQFCDVCGHVAGYSGEAQVPARHLGRLVAVASALCWRLASLHMIHIRRCERQYQQRQSRWQSGFHCAIRCSTVGRLLVWINLRSTSTTPLEPTTVSTSVDTSRPSNNCSFRRNTLFRQHTWKIRKNNSIDSTPRTRWTEFFQLLLLRRKRFVFLLRENKLEENKFFFASTITMQASLQAQWSKWSIRHDQSLRDLFHCIEKGILV